jgi:hypothetical protein
VRAPHSLTGYGVLLCGRAARFIATAVGQVILGYINAGMSCSGSSVTTVRLGKY